MNSPEDKKGQAPSKKGTLLIGLGLAAAVIVLSAAVFFLLKSGKVVDAVALEISDRKVTTAQLEKYTEAGKVIGASPAEVRRTVIVHEKNVQLADKYKIQVPEAFMLQQAVGTSAENPKASEYTKLVRYNRAFETRLSQLPSAGYGVIVYEFPAQALTSNKDENLASAKAVAAQFRSQITEFNQSSASVLQQVLRYNADNGQTANSGARFISEEVIFDDSATGSLMSDAYVLSQVKGKDTGVTEVQQSGANSAFFLDIMFDQKKQQDILGKIQQDKESMRVVEYDI